MWDANIKNIVLILLWILMIIFIVWWVIRVRSKLRKGPEVKKKREVKVLESVSSTHDSDSVFNSIISTKRIASNLKRRGIDTSKADDLITGALSDYDQGKEGHAKFRIEEAKELLLDLKKEWDKKTGFDVVASTPTAEPKPSYRETVDLMAEKDLETSEKESLGLEKAFEKKPDNYLPSKFTISMAETSIEDARKAGADVGEVLRLLMEAKTCFTREDYDGAFKLALDCKRNAEGLLGVSPVGREGEKEAISDLATLAAEKEELKICSICGEKKVPYICIEVKGGEEATCRECYDKTMARVIDVKPQPSAPPLTKGIAEKEEERAEEEGEEEEEEPHYCPNCGAKVKAEDVFCGKCGKPVQEELKCVGCGMKVEPGDVFCRKCGARLVT